MCKISIPFCVNFDIVYFSRNYPFHLYFKVYLLFSFIFISWRLITLQYCSSLTLKFICVEECRSVSLKKISSVSMITFSLSVLILYVCAPSFIDYID